MGPGCQVRINKKKVALRGVGIRTRDVRSAVRTGSMELTSWVATRLVTNNGSRNLNRLQQVLDFAGDWSELGGRGGGMYQDLRGVEAEMVAWLRAARTSLTADDRSLESLLHQWSKPELLPSIWRANNLQKNHTSAH